jgi:large subunit ribosomal protein L22
MLIKAKSNYIRVSPRKCRLVVDIIRGKKLSEAKDILRFTIKKPAPIIIKLLNSAESNAKNNFEINPETLYVSKITVDEGPKLKRWMPRSRGQANPIQKKTSHITVVLEALDGKIEKIKKDKNSNKEEKKVNLMKEKKEKKGWKEKESVKFKNQKETKKIFRRKSV